MDGGRMERRIGGARWGWVAAMVAFSAVAVVGAGRVGATPTVNDTETRLVASDAEPDDRLGRAVAVDDDVVVAGAWRNGDNGVLSGSVHVFEPDGGGDWAETKLTASDGRSLDAFGWSLAVDGNRVVVGAHRDTIDGDSVGSVYVFESSGPGIWNQVAKLVADDGADRDEFGHSVAVAGDRIVVGARRDDDRGSSAGAAYVFELDGAGTWVQTAKLTPPRSRAADQIGFSVAAAGDRLVVGAPYDDENDIDSGAAYVYELDGDGVWVEQKILPARGRLNEQFGHSVAMTDRRLVVGIGSFLDSAYVFERGDTAWRETEVLTPDDRDGADGVIDRFGQSVAIDGDRIAVGDPFDDDHGNSSGSAFVFDLDGSSWVGTKLVPVYGRANDEFGRAIGVSGDRLVVGAFRADPAGVDSGRVHVFEAGPDCLGRVSWIVGSGAIAGTDGPDVISGSDGPDRIDGLEGDDVICGLGGDDIVIGGSGDDRVAGGPGADDLRGSDGIDTVDYSDSDAAVRIVLNNRVDDGAVGEGDFVDPSIENAVGSPFGDAIVGNAKNNILRGGAGDDIVQGRGGDDDLYGGPGDDQLRASDGTDELFGGPGNDELRGAAGNDYLVGGPGDDVLLGWAGIDICKGSAGTDTYFGCEAALP